MTDDDIRIIEAMKRYGGGSFAKALAAAACYADDENLRKIKTTWPEYWSRYAGYVSEELAGERER